MDLTPGTCGSKPDTGSTGNKYDEPGTYARFQDALIAVPITPGAIYLLPRRLFPYQVS